MEQQVMSQDRTPTMITGQLEQWLVLLDTYGVQFLVVDKQHDGALLAPVRSQPDWGIDFEDRDAALLARVPVTETA